MNILEASNKLLNWFSKNNSFNVTGDFLKLVLISDTPETDKAALTCALKELERLDLLRSAEIAGELYYILIKPFSQFSQNVTISGKTAETISTIINTYCENVKDSENTCDKKSITERDIGNLITICLQVVEENKKKKK